MTNLSGQFLGRYHLLGRLDERPIQTRNQSPRFHCLGLSLIFIFSILVACIPANRRVPEEIISNIDTAFGEMAEKKRFSGSVLIAQDDQVLLSQGYGMADAESGEPNSPQTRFRIGSITKEFTATAILILQEQGKLNVQDPVCKYIGDCPAAWHEITIHHLLSHTSGISDRSFFEKLAGRQTEQFTPVELIALFRDTPLDFEPGKEWRYSNPGFILLGYVIEQVADKSYEEFLQEHIFVPLNLTNTGYDHMLNDVATCYSSYGHKTSFYDTSFMYAAGGLYSTVEDLYRWVQAFQTDPTFSKDTFDPLFTPYAPVASEEEFATNASYGYGWLVGERYNHRLIGHSGGYFGFAGYHEYYPDEKVTIIVLSNMDYWASPSAFTLPSELIFGEEK